MKKLKERRIKNFTKPYLQREQINHETRKRERKRSISNLKGYQNNEKQSVIDYTESITDLAKDMPLDSDGYILEKIKERKEGIKAFKINIKSYEKQIKQKTYAFDKQQSLDDISYSKLLKKTSEDWIEDFNRIETIKHIKSIVIYSDKLVIITNKLFSHLYTEKERNKQKRGSNRTGEEIAIGSYQITFCFDSSKPLIDNLTFETGEHSHWGVDIYDIPCLGEYDEPYFMIQRTGDIFGQVVLILDFIQNAGDNHAYMSIASWNRNKHTNENYKKNIFLGNIDGTFYSCLDFELDDKVKIIDHRYCLPYKENRTRATVPKNKVMGIVTRIADINTIEILINKKTVFINPKGLELL